MHWGEFLCSAILTGFVGLPLVMWHVKASEKPQMLLAVQQKALFGGDVCLAAS